MALAKFKTVILAVAIAIVFAFFIGFGIATFYESPQYDDFCGDRKPVKVETQEQCEAADGVWEVFEARPLAVPEDVPDDRLICTQISQADGTITLDCETLAEVRVDGYCDVDRKCRDAFDAASEPYNRNVFIIAVGIGILGLIVGVALNVAGVSAGLMGGGVLLIIYGTFRFWSDLPDYGRFIILGVALAILIWLSYKRFKK